jgi:hypothetical protein
MGSKFRLGPEIVSSAEKQEGAKRVSDQEKQKIYVNAQKVVPTTRKSKRVESKSQGEPDLKNKEKVNEGPAEKPRERQERHVPYVDLTPKKVDGPLTGPVKEVDATETHYKNRAPVEIGLDIEKLVEAVLKTELTIPLKDLAGISTIVQKEIRRQMTKTKIPVEETTVKLQSVEVESNEIRLEDKSLPMFLVTQSQDGEVPEGCMVAQDPVLQYLAENPDVKSESLVVSQNSEALRAIYGTVNGVVQEESLLDSGSMIISMSKKAAVESGLNWSPDVRIKMESASSHHELTLGLARNVVFAIGGLKFFLQIHILPNPPYRMLLGKPFDRLTTSTVKTFADGNTEVTLTDPNTKRSVVVPTYKRGCGPEQMQREQKDF